MRSNYLFFGLGCVLGGLVIGLIVRQSVKPAPTARAERNDVAFRSAVRTIEELRNENDEIRTRLSEQSQRNADLQEKIDKPKDDAAPEPEKAPELILVTPTEEDIKKAIGEFAQNFGKLIYGDPAGKAAAQKLRALLERAGEPAIKAMVARFEDPTEDVGARTILAHALAQSGHPAALEKLKEQLRDPDADMIMRRFASHALAFSDEKGLDTVLSQAARESPDVGVRANAAFGLQRRGVEEGLELYFAATDDALAKGDPQALQYIGGARLIGKKALPFLRERLGAYKETQALLVTILLVQRFEDKESIPALEKLAYDSSRPKGIQTAAQAALKNINKP